MEPASVDDRAEFVAFVRAHQHKLVRRAYLVCGEQQMAEDLVQDALVKLALRWRHLRDGEPEAFLRTVIYRDAVSWWRRRRREWLTDAPPGAGPGVATPQTVKVCAGLAAWRTSPAPVQRTLRAQPEGCRRFGRP